MRRIAADMTLVDVYTSPHAAAVLYWLLAERPKENFISHEKMPTIEVHEKFVASRPFRLWYLIEIEEVSVGALEVTDLNEIGIAIFQKYQRLGYARQALNMFLATHVPLPAIPAKRNGRWLANIGVSNFGSKKFFRKMDFHPLQETFIL